MPKESEILSAIAKTANVPMIVILGLMVLLNPIINAKLVMTAEVAPKLNFVRCVIYIDSFWKY